MQRMWLEYIRYRFRLNRSDDLLALTQLAALEALRNSPRCRAWRVLPAADGQGHMVLEIEWNPGVELTPFRGSEEFAMIHSVLASHARSLEEADYSVDARLLRRLLGEPEALFRLAEDIVEGVRLEPLLAWHFQSDDGSKHGRLGLWLLEVLGGPDMFSSSFPDSRLRDGPLTGGRLDLEERERLLEIASDALPLAREDQRRCVVGNLRAHLPLHPTPPSLAVPTPMLGPGAAEPSERRAPESAVRAATPSEPPVSAPSEATAGYEPFAGGALHEPDGAALSRGRRTFQSGVRPRVDEAPPAVQVAGHPWPLSHGPPSPSLRSRRSGRWPRWRARAR